MLHVYRVSQRVGCSYRIMDLSALCSTLQPTRDFIITAHHKLAIRTILRKTVEIRLLFTFYQSTFTRFPTIVIEQMRVLVVLSS